MRSLFSAGIVNPRDSAWMGQAQTAFVTSTPTNTTVKETNWWDTLAVGLESGAQIYDSYGNIREAEYGADAKDAAATAAAANLRTQQIMQQTEALRLQALQKQSGADLGKTALFVGAGLLGLLILGGTFMMMTKAK